MITVALIDDHLIVRSGFAQLLGLEPDLQVVAEFVETEEIRRAAISLGIDYMQGYLIGVPRPLSETLKEQVPVTGT